VATDNGGLLVISMVAYPGWTASIDGQSAPVLQVDGLLQGVCVPSGAHAVELRFTPSGWPAALAASLIGLLLVLYLGLAGRMPVRFRLELPHQRSQGGDDLANEPLARKPL